MKKRLSFALALCLCLLALLSACAPAYRDDARIGKYTAVGADGETIVYSLTLKPDGTGEIVHHPVIGADEREDVIFEIKDDTLYLHGTEVVGGVIGRNELYGTLVSEFGAYTVELRAAGGAPLANFVQETAG